MQYIHKHTHSYRHTINWRATEEERERERDRERGNPLIIFNVWWIESVNMELVDIRIQCTNMKHFLSVYAKSGAHEEESKLE